ncbi:tail fiber protein [Morganella phage vB_MmoP_MP2]|uniref:Tail fiber protein n=1 Tax=Morganella phage vB_MmoP_MP2 TaxID=1852627 RepID=A0A192Y9V4_9CAUD|nr:tail fiber protein [Morganella phage vB_MmoP_MP2]ANM46347.1 tail fiber protein [Morganella phage vB_MmoP_MP2]
MANVIKTVITYPLNGSTRDFQIPFEYLARKFVQVTLIGRDRKSLVNIQDYRFTSKTQITTTKTWGVGDGYELIELRRFTSATDRLVDFADGSILRAYDLNVSQIQTLHVAEEARDLTADTIGVNNEGHLDARGRRIVNVGDPVNALDAVNLKTIKEWNDGAYQSYLRAKEEAEKAARSATAAKTSESNSYSHMTQAGISEQRSKASESSAENSKNAAAASAQSAAQSAGSASNSAQEATGAKEYTKQQADRSYTEAERAKGYADSMGNAVDIGKVITEIDEPTGRVTWNGSHFYKSKDGSNTYSEWSSPNGYQKAWLGAYDDGRVLLSAFHSEYGWSNIRIPTGESGSMATKEWVNKMVYLPNDSVTRLKSPNGSYVVQVENGGIYGFKDTVKDIYTFAFKSGEPFFYDTSTINLKGKNDWPGFSLYRPNGSYVRMEANPENTEVLFNILGRNASGTNAHGFAIPTGHGTAATREWSNSQYVRKSPSYRRIWTGKFTKGDTITLSESIIGKVIAVKAYDRNRWETIHVLWAGSWATGAGNSVNMFTVSSNGRTLTSDYEAKYGYWTEIWVVE